MRAAAKVPKLVDKEILKDFATCGFAAKKTNKLVGYSSRRRVQLGKAACHRVIQFVHRRRASPSLMDCVWLLSFHPVPKNKSLLGETGQSLFYMGERNLQNKITLDRRRGRLVAQRQATR